MGICRFKGNGNGIIRQDDRPCLEHKTGHQRYAVYYPWCAMLWMLVVCATSGCSDADANPAKSATYAIPVKSSIGVMEPSLQEFDLQLGPDRFLRGLCELNNNILTVALPVHPDHARPHDLNSRDGETTRVIVLSREETESAENKNLIGTWKTVSARQSAKPSKEFLGHTLVFAEKTVQITESSNGESYAVAYRLNDLAKVAVNQQASVQVLRENYGADITLSSDGTVEELTVSGISADGKQTVFDDALAAQLGGLVDVKKLTLTDFREGLTQERMSFLEGFHNLQRLDIRNTDICDEALAAISELPHLTVLKLEFNKQLTDGLAACLESLTHLVELDLAFVNITDEAMPAIGRMTELQRLYLYGTGISDRGVEHLSAMTNLKALYLGGEQVQDVTDASIPVLSGLHSLELLGIYGTRISHAAADELKSMLSDCDILAPRAPAQAPLQSQADVGSLGTAAGTLTLDGQQFDLRHALAYQHILEKENVITVLLTTEPPPLGELKSSLKRYGHDYLFAPHIPQIRLRFHPDGSINRFHIYANEFTINASGTQLIADANINPQTADGSIRMNVDGTFEGKSYRVDAQFDVDVIE